MASATKVLLESIQVARHVGRLGLRPVQKAAGQVAQAGEEFAIWVLKLQPLQELIGRDRAKAGLDYYFQAKEVVAESLASLSHQSWTSALQTAAQYSTAAMRQIGAEGRVVGPFDEHWNTLKVIKDLRAAETERASSSRAAGLRLTPKRFVQFMREAERKKKRARERDPVEQYVERMLRSGHLSSMGPRFFEKKLYTDVARIICFSFDRAVMEANGADFWGHELQVKMSKAGNEEQAAHRQRLRSAIGTEQVEVMVDRMLKSPDLQVPMPMAGVQRQLLVNCSTMVLQLIEDLTSDQRWQVSVLGHSLLVSLEALPLERLLEEDATPDERRRFRVNEAAVDELVQALIEEPEVQLVLVPDIVEAEVYRWALHRMICIVEFVLSHLRISFFGTEVRFEFASEDPAEEAYKAEGAEGAAAEPAATPVHVPREDLQRLLGRIEAERQRVDQELQRRRKHEAHARRGSLDLPVLFEEEEGVHEFQTMAAQDRLSRSLNIQCTVEVPIEVAYSMVSDVTAYPTWMPFCTSARVLSTEEDQRGLLCEVGFGLETGTVLGTLGDAVRYRVTLSAPAGAPGRGQGQGLRGARVVADTPGGFRYGRRLVYDWRFTELAAGETDVRLDMFFQAGSVFFLPLWDSLQATVTGAMMQKFAERAEVLRGAGLAGDGLGGWAKPTPPGAAERPAAP